MVPSQKHFSKPLQNCASSGSYGGCHVGGESLGLMTLLRGYESESDPMSSDKEKAAIALNETGNDPKRSDQERDWLQLGIGGSQRKSQTRPEQQQGVQRQLLSPLPTPPRSSVGGPLRPVLDVTTDMFLRNPSLVFPFQHHQHHGHQEINWTFRPPSSAGHSFSSLSSLLPLQFHGDGGGGVSAGGGTASSDFRIIRPPPWRPQAGVWFMLRALPIQENRFHLPQIPKCYLRIKDGKAMVRLLIKYLVDKLKLDSESEIEITCKGQHLQPFLTLQHVRDNIWRNPARVLNHNDDDDDADLVTLLLPNSSTKDHIMVLHYARRIYTTIRSDSA